MNSINLTGNLTKDIEVRQTNSGKAVTTFDVAVKRPFSNETDFISCIAWEQKAEYLYKYAAKGTKVAVSGYITTRKWQDKNGANHIAYEVNCDGVEAFKNASQSTETYNPYNDSPKPSKINMSDIPTEGLPF